MTHLRQMKVLGSAKTSILKNTSPQNVNESFYFNLGDTENSALRIELKQKMLNFKGKTTRCSLISDWSMYCADCVLTSLSLGPTNLGEEAGRDHWEASLSQPLNTVSQTHCMLETPTRSISYDHLNLPTPTQTVSDI